MTDSHRRPLYRRYNRLMSLFVLAATITCGLMAFASMAIDEYNERRDIEAAWLAVGCGVASIIGIAGSLTLLRFALRAIPETTPPELTDGWTISDLAADADVAAWALSTLVLPAGQVVVHNLHTEEVVQEANTSAALLHLSGWSDHHGDGEYGACVMLAGQDADGRLVWAGHLQVVHLGPGQLRMVEYLVVPRGTIASTARVWVRLTCTGPISRPTKHASTEASVAKEP